MESKRAKMFQKDIINGVLPPAFQVERRHEEVVVLGTLCHQ